MDILYDTTGIAARRGVRSARRAAVRSESSVADLDSVMRNRGHPHALQRGQCLYHAAEPGHTIYVVVSGMIKESLVTSKGSEQVVQLYFENDLLGLNTFDASRHGGTAVALESTQTRSLPVAALAELCRFCPLVHHQLMCRMSEHIAGLQAHTFMLMKTAVGRTADYLLVLAARRPVRYGNLSLPMSLYEIGCYLGIALETVSRSLSELEREGVITKQGSMVHIRDWDRLERVADTGRVERC